MNRVDTVVSSSFPVDELGVRGELGREMIGIVVVPRIEDVGKQTTQSVAAFVDIEPLSALRTDL